MLLVLRVSWKENGHMRRQKIVGGIGAVLCGGMMLFGCARELSAQAQPAPPEITTTPEVLNFESWRSAARRCWIRLGRQWECGHHAGAV